MVANAYRRSPVLLRKSRLSPRERKRIADLSPLLLHVAGIAAAAGLAASGGVSQASTTPPAHLVYGCRVAQIWMTPGHHPVGLITPGKPFYVTRYSPSRRWALGDTGRPGQRLRTHGWVRRSALCRTPPRPSTTAIMTRGRPGSAPFRFSRSATAAHVQLKVASPA
jgi:hypothetical protein